MKTNSIKAGITISPSYAPSFTPSYNAFHYDQPLQTCSCGSPLKSKETMEKQAAWGKITFERCSVCESWVQSPSIALASVFEWLNSDVYFKSTDRSQGPYADYFADEQARRREAIIRVRRDLSRHLKPGDKVLEVGSATGSVLSAIRDLGCEVTAVDVSKSFAEKAEEFYGLKTITDDFMDCDFKENSFDAIVMLGTVTLLRNPLAHFKHAYSLLKPGGIFYFNYARSNSLTARWLGRNFWMFTPSIATIFSNVGSQKLTEAAGFKTIKTGVDWQNPTLCQILKKAGLGALYPIAKLLGIANLPTPFAIPIPGMAVRWVQKPVR